MQAGHSCAHCSKAAQELQRVMLLAWARPRASPGLGSLATLDSRIWQAAWQDLEELGEQGCLPSHSCNSSISSESFGLAASLKNIDLIPDRAAPVKLGPTCSLGPVRGGRAWSALKMHVARKGLEVQLGALPVPVQLSQQRAAQQQGRRVLPKLIQPGQRQPLPRRGLCPSLQGKADAIADIIKAKEVRRLWGEPNPTEESLALLVPCPPLLLTPLDPQLPQGHSVWRPRALGQASAVRHLVKGKQEPCSWHGSEESVLTPAPLCTRTAAKQMSPPDLSASNQHLDAPLCANRGVCSSIQPPALGNVTFLLPQTFYPQGAANLCPLPRQQQPFPAAWAPSLHVAPQGPQALPPPGLQRAPCGCFFDPRVFHIEWTVTSLPPPASSTLSRGTASLPGQSGGPRPPPALPTSIPGYRHIEGQPAQTNICGTATPAGAHPDTNIPPGSYDSPSQALEDLPGDLEVSDEELLQEALSLLGCSLDGVEASHEDAGSSPMHGDRGGTGAEGNTVALASPVLPTSSAAYQHVEEQPAQLPIYGTATTAEAHVGSNTPLGSNDPSCPSAASQNQVLGDLAGDLTVSEEVPLEEALRLFGCSLDTVGVSQDAFSSSSSPVPGELGGTGTATPHCDFASLSLPEELLTPDYSIPETTDTILSLGEFYTMGMEPQEPWGAAGMALPPSQAAACEKRGKKRGQSALPKPASKRRALAGSTGVAGGGKPMPAGSKTDPPLAKAKPISASVIT
ncbi:proline-rich protein 22-like [Grus japonensis]|uniref:Proline-rich protein 22-like n=1 Tax=Grus japonensis TaxID=30415 RepID=A0ABC9Y9Z0_GRUJA